MNNARSKNLFVEEMKRRTKSIAVRSIRFCNTLKNTTSNHIIIRQLIRSATSVGANYRAVCRSRSKAEFYSKLSITIEEADETLYWYEIISELEITNNDEIKYLKSEMTEILSILARARKNTKK